MRRSAKKGGEDAASTKTLCRRGVFAAWLLSCANWRRRRSGARNVIGQSVVILICIASLLLYRTCGLRHVCMAGHMQHPPYDQWEYALDVGWFLGFALLGVVACFVGAPGRLQLVFAAAVLCVSRLAIGSGGGYVFVLEWAVALSMVVSAASGFVPAPAPVVDDAASRKAPRRASPRLVVLYVALVVWLVPIYVAIFYAEALYSPAALLSRAVYEDDTRTVERIAIIGLNWKDLRGETALHKAASREKADVCRVLLENGANVNARDRSENTPLHEAGNAVVARILLDYGADVHARDDIGNTPLHGAWPPDKTEVLLARGADVHATNKFGRTPLSRAGSESARLLILAGSDVNHADQHGTTALHDAARYAREREFLELLIANGADIHARTVIGNTPLHWAAMRNNVMSAQFLLEHGVDPEARNAEGKTPRDVAEGKGKIEFVQFLDQLLGSAETARGIVGDDSISSARPGQSHLIMSPKDSSSIAQARAKRRPGYVRLPSTECPEGASEQ